MEMNLFPSLPLAEWRATRDTLHKYCKMVGVIRENFTKPQPHWWHASLQLDKDGLTTLPLQRSPDEPLKTFEVKLNLVNRKLLIISSYRETMLVALTGQSLNALCDETCSLLQDLGIRPPLEKPSFIDGRPGKFDSQSIQNYWTAINNISSVFMEFKAAFKEKSSPVQLWPHHFDLALSWFSGRLIPGKDPKIPEESQEQMTFGFSTGDETIPDAYFYATAYPSNEEFFNSALPEGAYWNRSGFKGAVMLYNSLVKDKNPAAKLMEFLRTVHSAGINSMIKTFS